MISCAIRDDRSLCFMLSLQLYVWWQLLLRNVTVRLAPDPVVTQLSSEWFLVYY